MDRYAVNFYRFNGKIEPFCLTSGGAAFNTGKRPISGTYVSEAANFKQGVEAESLPDHPVVSTYPTMHYEQLARIGSHLFDVDVCVVLAPGQAHWMRSLDEIVRAEGASHSRNFGNHRAILIQDALKFAPLQSNALVCEDPGVRFVACSHLVSGDTKFTMDVYLADREPRVWTDMRASLFGDFLSICSEILNGEAHERELVDLVEESRLIRRLATTDHLTGLWNRKSILEILERELERCFREQLPISIIVADLDHFKEVNDRHGHLAGDAVLEEVARRLRRAVRTYDAVGRVGGEEFLIVMSNCDESIAATVAERIHDVIRGDEMPAHHTQVAITISQGLVTYFGEKRISPMELFEKADKALYAAKAKGRDGIQRNTESD